MSDDQRNHAQLGLPAELFRQVIDELVVELGIERAAKYRLVNHRFDDEINDVTFNLTSKENLKHFSSNPQLRRFFQAHGSALMVKKVLRNDTVWDQRESLINVAKYLTEKTMEHFGADPNDKVRYLTAICTCMTAITFPEFARESKLLTYDERVIDSCFDDLLPAIGTFINDATTISSIVNDPLRLFIHPKKYFPTALTAAVASNDLSALKQYLICIQNALTGRRDKYIGQRNATALLGQGLNAAARLHQNKAGHIILDFFQENQKLYKLSAREFPDQLFRDAVRAGNIGLFYRVLEFVETIELMDKQDGPFGRTPGEDARVRFLLRHGRKCLVERLIYEGFINPNRRLRYVPVLEYALRNRRRDLAEALLMFGANMYSRNPSGGTIFWDAIKKYDWGTTRLLLAFGGDPDKACPKKRNRWVMSRLNHFKEDFVTYRISQMEGGRDQLRRRDLSLSDLRCWEEMRQFR